MVLAALEELVSADDVVLDVGCGSGVLAIGAARLGAARIVGIDVDPAAVTATTANAEANGVADRIEVSATPLTQVGGSFDLVLANIGAGVLREAAPELERRVRTGGHLVLAGLLDAQVGLVVAAYPGCAEVARTSEDGWTTVTLAR
jgi:ribosomal protein L11 methyltransferase